MAPATGLENESHSVRATARWRIRLRSAVPQHIEVGIVRPEMSDVVDPDRARTCARTGAARRPSSTCDRPREGSITTVMRSPLTGRPIPGVPPKVRPYPETCVPPNPGSKLLFGTGCRYLGKSRGEAPSANWTHSDGPFGATVLAVGQRRGRVAIRQTASSLWSGEGQQGWISVGPRAANVVRRSSVERTTRWFMAGTGRRLRLRGPPTGTGTGWRR